MLNRLEGQLGSFAWKWSSMASVRIRGFESINKRITQRVLGEIRKSGLLQQLGSNITQDVKKGAQVGQSSWPKLSQKWSDYRDKLASINRTDPEYRSGRNNLTFTGQLLDSLKTFIQVSKLRVIIRPTGNHKKYKRLRTGKVGEGKPVKNQDIMDYQAERGRVAMILKQREVDKITILIREYLSRVFRNILK